MRRSAILILLGGVMAFSAPLGGRAQDAQEFLAVGELAPDFQVVGATRFGVLSEAVNLSDFRGETVVLAFFFRARTGG